MSKTEIAQEVLNDLWSLEVPDGEFINRRPLTDDEESLKAAAIDCLFKALKKPDPPPRQRKPANKKPPPPPKKKVKA